MPGNKSNVRFWDEIDVHVTDDLTAVLPETPDEDLPAAFQRAGLITPDGFNKNREEEVNDHFAFGRDGLVGQTRKNFKESWGFAFLEDNDVTFSLVYPGSTQERIIVPKPKPVKAVFTLRNSGTGREERWMTAGHAIFGVDGEVPMNDSDPTSTPMVATIVAADADTSGEAALYDRQVITGDEGAGVQSFSSFGEPLGDDGDDDPGL